MSRTKRDRSNRRTDSPLDYTMERAVARVLAVAGLGLAVAMTACLVWLYPEADDGENS